MSVSSVVSVISESREELLVQLHAERARRERAEEQAAALRLELSAAQTTMQHHYSRLAALAQNLQMGIVLVDNEDRVILLNRPYCQLFGLTQEPQSLYGATGPEITALIQHNYPDPAAYMTQAQALRVAGRTRLNEEVLLADGRVLERDYIVMDDVLAGRLVCYRDVTVRYRRTARTNSISLLAQQSPNPILRLTLGGELLYANPAASHLVQAYRQEDPNELWAQLLHIVGLVLRTAAHHQREITVADKHYLLIVAPVPGAQYASLYLTDITARRTAENKLVEQREFYETILNQLPVGVVVLDAEHRYLFVNPAVAPDPVTRSWLLGKTNREASLYRQRSTEMMEQREVFFAQAIEERQAVSWEEEINDPHGVRYLLRSFRPVFAPQGNLRMMISSGLDITERHRAEQQLAQQREFYEAILNQLPTQIGVFDAQHRYLFVNPAGIKNDEIRAWIIGKDHFEYCAYRQRPLDMAVERRSWFEKVISERAQVAYEESIPGPNGTERMLRCLKPVFYPDGSLHMVLAYGLDITERHRAEQQLVEQRAFYESVLNQLPADIAVFDAQHRYLFVNPVGIKNPALREWIIGKDEFEYCAFRQQPTDMAQQRWAMFEQAIRERGQVMWEEAPVGADGSRYFLRRFHPVFHPDGSLHLMLAYGLDITERHQAEEMHRRSELVIREQQEFISQIVDTIPNLLYVNNEEGQVLFANAAFEDISHRSNHLHIATTKTTAAVAEASEMQLLYALNQRVLTSRREEKIEMPFTLANGKTLQYQVVKRPLLRPDGTVQVLTVSTDITEIKRIRYRLERNAKQYRDLMQHTQALICTHDLGGIILSVNPALAALLGTTIERMIGARLERGLEVEGAVDIGAYLAAFNQQREVSGTVWVQPVDSTQARCLLYHNCLVAEAGEAPYVIAYAQDITERMLAENELRRAKREAEASARSRENFLANMSHEIRTPMNGVLGMASLLARTTLTSQQREYLDIIRNSGQHLLGVLNDVLDVAKITAGHLELERTCFDLSHTLNTAAQTVAFRATAKGIDFKIVNLPEAGLLVLSDPYRLSQVLLNLLTNSLKFTDQGTITLACQRRAETASTVTICFQVADTGMGVPPDKQETIFASFSQAYADTTRRYGGTGLGLTISSSLVEQLGGYLSMCSEPGQGSTFAFTLTFEKAPQGSLTTPKAALEPDSDTIAAVRGRRLLLVEDHDVNRQLVQLVLANYEVAVDAAVDGPSALHLFDQHRYDVILMDIQMPGMSGLEVTARIRKHTDSARAHTPIIALTANNFHSDNEKYLAAGMDACLTKPFEEAELLRLIAALLAPQNTCVPLFDLSDLYQMAHGKMDFVTTIIDSLLGSLPQVVAQLTTATAANKWDQVGFLTHKIKPSLKMLRADALLSAVQLLEVESISSTDRVAVVEQLLLLLPRLHQDLLHWKRTAQE